MGHTANPAQDEVAGAYRTLGCQGYQEGQRKAHQRGGHVARTTEGNGIALQRAYPGMMFGCDPTRPKAHILRFEACSPRP
jgi:hypothetical protein